MKAFLIIVSIIGWIVFGCLSCDLRSKKGYDGGFLMGFLFVVFALIYNAGLPDIYLKNQLTTIDNYIRSSTKKINASLETMKSDASLNDIPKPEIKNRTVSECEADALKSIYTK